MRIPHVLAVALAGGLALAGIGVSAPAAGSTPQSPSWDSGLVVTPTVSNTSVELWEVAVSAAGVPVVAGVFKGTASVPTGPAPDDSISLTALANGRSLLVGAMNDEGTYFTWATQVSTTGCCSGATVTVLGAKTPTDVDDTIMVAGRVWGTAYFPSGPNADDSIVLPDSGTSRPRGFIAAIAPGESHFSWVTEIASTVRSGASSMAVRANGDLLVAGSFEGTASFPTSTGSITIDSPNADSGFVAQMAADDTGFSWVQRIGASGQSGLGGGASVAVSADDTPYVSSHFNGTLTFPTGPVPDDSVTVSTVGQGADLVVAQLNADDSYFTWAQAARVSGDVTSTSLEVDAQGSPVVVGYFYGSLSFPTGSGDDSVTLTSNGTGRETDIYIAKMNADDTYFDWAMGIGGPSSDDEPGETQMTSTGELLIPGGFSDTMQFPSSSGTIDLTAAAGSNGDIFVAQMDLDTQMFTWAQRGGVAASDYAFGYAVNALADGRPILAGDLFGTMNMVGADPAIALVSQRNGSGLIGVLGAAPTPPDPTPPTPTPSTPPSSPRDVSAAAGDGSAMVTWSAPASSGSFPVTNYQVQATPGGQSCLVSAPTLSCEMNGLTNGTSYAFTVRALSGAGWSSWSSPSDPVTPTPPNPPVEQTIVISGSRSTQGPSREVRIMGTTTGFDEGAVLRPWLRFPGQNGFRTGLARIEVSSSGDFTWKRRTAKKVAMYVASADGDVRSNRVVIPAASPAQR